ncbi:hypothetical protein [Aquisalibacillus elongatus]|uniref:Uncharacterized protein n=1 Tax=Aquisalibacillus elongatus TaxID=485577 RepID=A0A3N5CAR5_9BACI|nr:hypothetical protein [Aquisalibacillus elongatus]RPF53871.1 hypothetical protein EDC24_1054 [Aquisalibacillus elongatus]
MEDERKEERIRREEPSRTGSTAIKWISIIVITLIILFFLINYVFPLFNGNGGGGQGQGDDNTTVELEMDSGGSSDQNSSE